MSYQEARSTGGSYDSNAFEYDGAIVGGGSAGYAAARTSAAAGQRTVVIDDGVDDGSRTRQLAALSSNSRGNLDLSCGGVGRPDHAVRVGFHPIVTDVLVNYCRGA